MEIDRTYVEDLRFERADFSESRRVEHCGWCTRVLEDSYHRVVETKICGVCAERARGMLPVDTRAVFWRAAGFGALAAAMLGLAYYLLYRETDGSWMIFASIGVGYLIAKAMRFGSGGVGGRRYQWMAIGLTYGSVAIASGCALFGSRGLPWWGGPFYLLAPFVALFVGQVTYAATQLLVVGVGKRWAWGLMAGAPLKVSGPHVLEA